MTKPIEKTFGVLNPVFQGGDVLVVCGSHDYWRAQFRRREFPVDAINDDDTGTVFDVQHKDGRLFVMVLPPATYSGDWYDTLAHEISHLVDSVLARHNATGPAEHNEPRAYLAGFYMRTILAGLTGLKARTFNERHFSKGKKQQKKETQK